MQRKLTKIEMIAMANGRASARKLETLVDGNLRTVWVPRLAGFNVSENGIWKFTAKADAINVARRVRSSFRQKQTGANGGE